MTTHEWRALIGPAYLDANRPDRFEWWTPANLDASAVLAADLEPGDTAMTFASGDTSIFDSRGGVWVAGNGSGEAWEYVGYTAKSATQLTGCTREDSATREHSGRHTAGATVRQWWLLDDDNGTLRATEQLSENLSTITWTVTLEGIKAPVAALRPGHVAVIQTRERGGAWAVAYVGFVRSAPVRDDYRRRREWSIEIVCVSGVLAGHQAPGVRIGAQNLLKYGSASSDTVLADPRKESTSGDYTASNPDLSAASAIDDDLTTLWIGERFVGTPADTTPPAGGDGDNAYAKMLLIGARINRYPGEADQSRWLEWRVQGVTFPALALITSDEDNSESIGDLTGWSSSTGDTVIICEDEATFKRYNPLAEPTKLVAIGSRFFDDLSVTSDAVGWYSFTSASIYSAGYSWGAANKIRGGGDESPTWSGAAIAAPAAGQIIRYNYNSGAAALKDHWIVDYADIAGYKANDGDDPWLAARLPLLDLVIGEAMTASTPATLRITDSAGNPSTIGLEDSGTIQVGTEQITYGARADGRLTISARGANSTTATAHDKGDMVRVVADGAATVGRLIERIEWERAQAPYPRNFKIYRSVLDNPRNPGASGWTGDWTLVATVTEHASTLYGYDFSPAVRATAVAITVDKMSADPARVRVNDLRVIGSLDEFESGHAIEADDANTVLAALVAAADANVSLSTPGTAPIVAGVTTEPTTLWPLLADMAEYGNCLIDCKRDGSIEAAVNGLIAGSLTPAATLDEDDIADIEYVQQTGQPVGFVRMPWIDADGLEQPAVEYPASHAANAVPVELPAAAYPSEVTATAGAKRAYILLRYPTVFVAQLATAQPALRPGTILALGWSFDHGTEPIDRVVIVNSVDHELANGQWKTVAQLRQVDREAPG